MIREKRKNFSFSVKPFSVPSVYEYVSGEKPRKSPNATSHNIVCGALRIFCAVNALQFLEIHKVFLRNRAFFRRKISLQIALAELYGVALKNPKTDKSLKRRNPT